MTNKNKLIKVLKYINDIPYFILNDINVFNYFDGQSKKEINLYLKNDKEIKKDLINYIKDFEDIEKKDLKKGLKLINDLFK